MPSPLPLLLSLLILFALGCCGEVAPSDGDRDVVGAGIVEQSGNLTIRAGKDTAIRCLTGGGAVSSCVWLWEFPGRDRRPTVVAGYPGHGPTAADCSINLVNVSQIQTGWWTCRAQAADNTILQARPIFLQVYAGPIVTFTTSPTNRTLAVGAAAELECRTAISVQSCRWSFQQRGQTEPLVVTEGPPRPETATATDCSFHLEHVEYEQVGAWRCGARTDAGDPFTYTDTVYIELEHMEDAEAPHWRVEFDEEPADTVVEAGRPARLQCRVRADAPRLQRCRWYWQPVGRGRAWTVLVREFLPAEDDRDCSVELAANATVGGDAEGTWTCHVRPLRSARFQASRPGRLTVTPELPLSESTREVSAAEGEPVRLACVTERPATSCHWRRRSDDQPDTPVVTQGSSPDTWTTEAEFAPADGGVGGRDCSMRLDHVGPEQHGLWLCAVVLADDPADQPPRDALPTALTVRPPEVLRFEEVVGGARLAAEGRPALLPCLARSAVLRCIWTWHDNQSQVAVPVVKYNVSANGRDCSVELAAAERAVHQGVWQCAALHGDPRQPTLSRAPPFTLAVVPPVDVRIRSARERVQCEGSEARLECRLLDPAVECLWLRDGAEFGRFLPPPGDPTNCGLAVARSACPTGGGLFTCGARGPAQPDFTMAPPSRLDFITVGNVTSRSLVSGDLAVLVCQMQLAPPPPIPLRCDFIHPADYSVFELNATGKYLVERSRSQGRGREAGVCSVSFAPSLADVGHWRCVFSSADNSAHVLGEASFTVLASPQNVRLSWVVAVLATLALVLAVLLFASVSCRRLPATSASSAVSAAPPCHRRDKRYSDDPTKGINFSFTERPELLVDFSMPPTTPTSVPTTASTPTEPHHYERVGQRPSFSFYQNVQH